MQGKMTSALDPLLMFVTILRSSGMCEWLCDCSFQALNLHLPDLRNEMVPLNNLWQNWPQIVHCHNMWVQQTILPSIATTN